MKPNFSYNLIVFLLITMVFSSHLWAKNIDSPVITLTGGSITKYLTINAGDSIFFEAIPDDLMKAQKRDYDFSWNYVDRRNGGYNQSLIITEEKIYASWKLNYVNLTYERTFNAEGLFEIKINGYRKNPWDDLQFTVKWIITVNPPPAPIVELKTLTINKTSPEVGDTFDATANVSNRGNATAANVKLRFYLNGSQFSDDTMYDIAASNSKNETSSNTIFLIEGNNTVKACFISTHEVYGSSCISKIIYVKPLPKPIVELKTLIINKTSPEVGDTFDVTANVYNRGDAAAANVKLRFYLNGNQFSVDTMLDISASNSMNETSSNTQFLVEGNNTVKVCFISTHEAYGASCKSTNVYVTVVLEPEILSAYWLAPLERQAGEIVQMRAEVTGIAEGEQLAFDVYEDEIYPISNYFRTSVNAIVKKNSVDGKFYAEGQWQAQWLDDGVGQGDPEYLFIAKYSDLSLSSGESDDETLEVIPSTNPNVTVGLVAGKANFYSFYQGTLVAQQSTNITIAIQNTSGDTINTPFTVKLADKTDNTIIHTWTIDTLAGGETTELVLPSDNSDGCTHHCFVQSGEHQLELTINTESIPNEIKTDNTHQFSVKVHQTSELPKGITVITHGYILDANDILDPDKCGDRPEWTLTMAESIQDRLMAINGNTNIWIYSPQIHEFEIYGRNANQNANENVLVFDWAKESCSPTQGYSEAAAEALLAGIMDLKQQNKLGLDSIHLIGHSRGTVVNSELAERLILSGHNVSHITTLDPHDWGQNGSTFNDYDVNGIENGVINWQGTGWSDNYYQENLQFNLIGRPVTGASNLDLGAGINHSQVHDFYQGTINPFTALGEDEQWYSNLGISRLTHGYNLSDKGGRAYTRSENGLFNSQFSSNEQTDVRLEFTDLGHGIVNGNGQRRGDLGGMPGWEHHGAIPSNAQLTSDGVFKLVNQEGKNTLAHNNLYVPPSVVGIQYDACRYANSAGESITVQFAGKVVATANLVYSDSRCSTQYVALKPDTVGQLTFTYNNTSHGDHADDFATVDNVQFITAFPENTIIEMGLDGATYGTRVDNSIGVNVANSLFNLVSYTAAVTPVGANCSVPPESYSLTPTNGQLSGVDASFNLQFTANQACTYQLVITFTDINGGTVVKAEDIIISDDVNQSQREHIAFEDSEGAIWSLGVDYYQEENHGYDPRLMYKNAKFFKNGIYIANPSQGVTDLALVALSIEYKRVTSIPDFGGYYDPLLSIWRPKCGVIFIKNACVYARDFFIPFSRKNVYKEIIEKALLLDDKPYLNDALFYGDDVVPVYGSQLPQGLAKSITEAFKQFSKDYPDDFLGFVGNENDLLTKLVTIRQAEVGGNQAAQNFLSKVKKQYGVVGDLLSALDKVNKLGDFIAETQTKIVLHELLASSSMAEERLQTLRKAYDFAVINMGQRIDSSLIDAINEMEAELYQENYSVVNGMVDALLTLCDVKCIGQKITSGIGTKGSWLRKIYANNFSSKLKLSSSSLAAFAEIGFNVWQFADDKISRWQRIFLNNNLAHILKNYQENNSSFKDSTHKTGTKYSYEQLSSSEVHDIYALLNNFMLDYYSEAIAFSDSDWESVLESAVQGTVQTLIQPQLYAVHFSGTALKFGGELGRSISTGLYPNEVEGLKHDYSSYVSNASKVNRYVTEWALLIAQSNANSEFVFTPSTSIVSGSYYEAQQILLSASTVDNNIRYTLNGSEPTLTHGELLLGSGLIDISQSLTLRAIAFNGDKVSKEVSETYTIIPTEQQQLLVEENSYQIYEGHSLTIPVKRLGSLLEPLNVSIESSGSAIAESDYSLTTSDLNIQSGQFSSEIIIKTFHDEIIENDESIELVFTGDFEQSPLTVSVNLLDTTEQNNPPEIKNHYVRVSQSQSINGNLEATDEDAGDTLLFFSNSSGTYGVFSLSQDGSYNYTATGDFIGQETIEIWVSDGLLESYKVHLVFEVYETFDNTKPIAEDFSPVDVVTSNIYSGQLIATDKDNDVLTFTVIRSAVNGEFIFNENTGSFTYQSVADYVGSDFVTYLVSDGKDNSNIASVAINVTASSAENQKPTVQITSPESNTILENTESSIQFTGTASDVDGTIQTVNYRLDNGEWATATGTGNWSFMLTDLSIGHHTVDVHAIDDLDSSSINTLYNIERKSANESLLPEIDVNGGLLFELENETLLFTFSGNASYSSGEIALVEYRYNDFGWKSATGTNNWSISVDSLNIGDNYITIRAKEAKGLQSLETKIVITRKADANNQIPTLEITDPEDNITVLSDVTQYSISGIASDIDGTVSQIEYRQNGGTWKSTQAADNWSFVSGNLQYGVNEITVRVQDNNGAYSSLASITVSRDSETIAQLPYFILSTPTEISVSYLIEQVAINGSVWVDPSLSVTSVEYRIGEGDWLLAQGTEQFTIVIDNLLVGETEVELRTTDSAGQLNLPWGNKVIITRLAQGENTAPEIAIFSPIENVSVDTLTPSDLTITGMASDFDGNVEAIYYRVNANNWKLIAGLDNWQLSITELVEGDNVFAFKAIDNGGAESSYAQLLISVVFPEHGSLLTLTLNNNDSYDFSERKMLNSILGDFIYYSQDVHGFHSFTKGTFEQRGLISLGILNDLTPSNTLLPLGGFSTIGANVNVVEGHSYISLAREGEEGSVIFFTVKSLTGSSVTIEYQYLLESDFITEDPKLFADYQVTDSALQSCIDTHAKDNGFTYIHELSDLACFDGGVSDLSGLENFTSLKRLQIIDSTISNLEALSVLNSLNLLAISGGTVSNLSPIANLLNLSSLNLQVNNISDINHLAKLTKLTFLNLGNNNISDLKVLSSFNNLKELYLGGNQISDISVLSYLVNLQYLSAPFNNITNISMLNKLNKLTTLLLSGNNISDIYSLKNLNLFVYIDLKYNDRITCVDVSNVFYSIDELPAECFISSALDSDSDGVEDSLDAFPTKAAASVDTDLDGMPDSFFASCNETCITESGLTLDLDDDNDGILDIDDEYPLENNSFTLDINGDGKVSLPIDGFIILRSMVGFPASALASNDDMFDASRTRDEMAELLNNAKENLVLDINGDGKVSLPIDGFIILRHMVGFPASSLASDEDMTDATRTRDEMKLYMESF
jgi:Leucine-rich repeat (LRR) protein